MAFKAFLFHPITILFAFVCGVIALALGTSITLDDSRNRAKWRETVCTTNMTSADAYPCCDIINCVCSECAHLERPSCSAAVSALVPGDCCGAPKCCETRCETCCHQEAYQDSYRCNCRSSSGQYRCDTCYRTRYRTVCRQCNCRCVRSVAAQQCTVACGTCWSLSSTYNVRVLTPSGFISDPHTVTGSCSRDNQRCQQNWLDNHIVGTEHRCFYRADNYHEVSFDSGVRDYNVAAIVFEVIFGTVAAVWLIAAGVVGCMTFLDNHTVQVPDYQSNAPTPMKPVNTMPPAFDDSSSYSPLPPPPAPSAWGQPLAPPPPYAAVHTSFKPSAPPL